MGFFRHLPEAGWDPLVLAPRDPHFHQAPLEGQEDPASVIRTGSLELSRVLRRGLSVPRPDSLQPAHTGGPGPALRRLVRDYLYVPDAQVGWIPFLVRAGTRVLEREKNRKWVLFSSSVPYSAHLAAARLAARVRVPWVAEFRDPWSAQDPSRLPVSTFRRKLDARVEGWVLRRARHIVVTAHRTEELLFQHFPETPSEKVTVIPNGFEPGPPGKVPDPAEPMTLVHAGTLQDPAYLAPLLAAVATLEADRPGSVRIISHGDRGPWRTALQDLELGEPDWVDLRGVVSPDTANRAMAGASALLLFYPHIRFARVISGKLFSYLGARRPILGVVPPGSEMEELIFQAGDGWLVPEWDEAGIRRQLNGLLEEHRHGRLQSPRVPAEAVASFTRKARAGDLARVLEEVLERGDQG